MQNKDFHIEEMMSVATKKNNKFIKKIVVITFIIITIISLIIFSNFCDLKKVDGNSMYPTIEDNDIVIVKKLFKEIKLNDVIVFYFNGMELIKRIIAIEGDIVKVEQGQLFVNDECIANFTKDFNESSQIIVAPNECYVVGDNYDESHDSRKFGAIKIDEIRGIVVKVL